METGGIAWRQDVHNADQAPDGYKYIGPTYELPNGAGRLENVNFNTYGGNIQELPLDNSQSAMVCISVDFIPALDDGNTYKWVQTYWTNAFLHSGSETNCDDVTDCFNEYVDCGGQTDPSKSCYFTQTNKLNSGGINLQDCHRRYPCPNKSIEMFCTSSVVNASNNNNPVVTIYWGYHISEKGVATFSLQICPTTDSPFHKIAIQNAR
ncbi:MAG: hypothetical protein MJZ87_02905 [Bacteroidales bacterium]|nr:hypothetical protein [Bacteroidales bacterium]